MKGATLDARAYEPGAATLRDALLQGPAYLEKTTIVSTKAAETARRVTYRAVFSHDRGLSITEEAYIEGLALVARAPAPRPAKRPRRAPEGG